MLLAFINSLKHINLLFKVYENQHTLLTQQYIVLSVGNDLRSRNVEITEP